MSKILLVDDDSDFRGMLRETLHDAGHTTLEASNGAAALTLHRQDQADLVITDLIMPVREGIQTILDFRHLDPHLPIIAVSGRNLMQPNENLTMAKQLGADLTLAKPFHPEEILAAIAQVLKQAVG